MTRLVAFFLDRPIVVKLVIFAITVLGINSIVHMQKEGFPNITFKQVFITVIYPGASAEDVEKNVTIPIEEKLSEVTGIEELVSTSSEGMATIIAEVDENATRNELKKIYDDIDSKVSQVDDLPNDLEGRPILELLTSDDIPIIELALSSDNVEQLKQYAKLLERKIERIKDVTNISMVGLPDDEVHILVDPKKAKNYQIGLRSIANAIKSRNMEGSGGTLESFLSEKKVVSVNKFDNYTDVLDTYLRVSDTGHSVQLKHLATVEVKPKEMNLRVRNNGAPGISLLITKGAKSDIINTIDAVKEVIAKYPAPPEIQLLYLNDQSAMTRNRLNLVISNAMIGAILVIGILFLVFDGAVAVWTAFGIPFSFLGAFILLGMTDVTLNMLTLGGFIIVLGMLVDDAIVVAENIQSYREGGMKIYDACIQGVKDIWLPVLAASLTTIVAFTPVLSFGGMPGQFIFIIPLIVILALSVSLFDTYFILPSHLLHVSKNKDSKKKKNNKREEKKKFVLVMESFYKNLLEKALHNSYKTLALFIGIFILTLLGMKFFVHREAFPQEAAEGFNISYRLPKGASFQKTTEVEKKIASSLAAMSENELSGFSSRQGTHSSNTATARGSGHNLGITFVYLTDYSKRKRTAEEIMLDFRDGLLKDDYLKENVIFQFELKRIGPPMGRPFEVRVAANDEDLRREKVNEIKSYLGELNGVYDVEDDNLEGKDELNIKLNYKILNLAGLTIEDVLQTLRIAFDGQIVTSMVTLENIIDFRLRLNAKSRANIESISQLPIQNRMGNLINLAPFIRAQTRSASSEIKHINGKRTTTIFGNIDMKKISGAQVVTKVAEKFQGSENHEIVFAGQPVEAEKIFGNVGSGALIAILGVYIIISLAFNSFFQPLVILLAIPFELTGIVFSAITHGVPMSMFAGIAMVGLTGVVVNDAIVMVHTIKEKAKGALNHDAILNGAVGRLRPILLTTITTILGVFPTAYGLGGMDPFVSQMCLFLGYGLLFSTLIVLFLIPVLFMIGVNIHNHSKKQKSFL